MSNSAFPLPDVAEALGPYIRPRVEVSDLRAALHSQLRNSLEAEDEPLSIVNLTSPEAHNLGDLPNIFPGVRKAYWRALHAHQAAQARLDALKSELDSVSGSAAQLTAKGNADSITQVYLPLLRQRQKKYKLSAIERALSGVTAGENDPTTSSVDGFLNAKVGDMPMPPVTQSKASRPLVNAEGSIGQLKKAVLAAQRDIKTEQSHKDRLPSVHSTQRLTPDAELRTLREVHTVLTTWIEEQLAKISGAGAEVEPEQAEIGTLQHPPVEETDQDRVTKQHELYDCYINARQHLISTFSQQHEDGSLTAGEGVSSSKDDISQSHKQSAASTVLPYIDTLISTAREEKELGQQTSYLRRQLSTADTEVQRLIARLADESHLVHPGASSGLDWSEAGAEAAKSTRLAVRQRLKDGAEVVRKAEVALRGVSEVAESMDAVMPSQENP